MADPKNKQSYYLYKFLNELSIRKPDAVLPYIARLKKEQKVITD